MVQQHLKECANCQKELSAMRHTIRLLTKFGEMDPPADFVQELRQRIETRRRRPILERLLPRPAFARVLAGASCLILAGFGVWLAVRQLLPPEEVEKYEAGDEIRGERLAFVREEEKEFLPEAANELAWMDFEAGEKLGVVDNDVTEGEWHYSDAWGTRRGKAPAPTTETPGAELSGAVVAKGTPTRTAWDRVPSLPTEEEPPAESKRLLADDRGVRSYAVQLEGRGKKAGKPLVDAPGKALAEAGRVEATAPARDRFGYEKAKEGPVAREDITTEMARTQEHAAVRENILHEKKESQRRARDVVGEEAVRGGAAGVESKSDIAQEPMAWSMEDGSRMAKFRVRSGREIEEARKDVDGNGVELRHGEEKLAEETTSLGMRVHVQKPEQEKKELGGLAENYAYVPLFLNGADQWQEGVTGLPQVEVPDSGLTRHLHFALGDFAAYDTFGTGIPPLVRYVKDRKEARAEIEKVVADLGGSIGSDNKETAKLGRAFGEGEVDTLIVKLKPGTYDEFLQKLGGESLKKLLPRRGSTIRGPRSAEPADGQRAEGYARKKDAEVTVVIFLVEISQQKEPDQPSPKQPPSDS